MNVIFLVTLLNGPNPVMTEELHRRIQRSFAWAHHIPAPGDLFAVEEKEGTPPTIYHVNRRILHSCEHNVVWEIVLEDGAQGLFAGREFIQGIVGGMVRSSSKKVLTEQQQISLITDTIYEALKGRVIHG